MAKKPGRVSKRIIPYHNTIQQYTKIVTSETCSVCTNQCSRGIRYLQLMSRPGAVGKGVPCILTKYKISK